MSGLPPAAAYRAAAARYLAVEAQRWAAQLRLDVAIAERRDPAIVCFRHECVCAAAAALCDATTALELCEAELRAACKEAVLNDRFPIQKVDDDDGHSTG